jgi:hypothetical protein
MGHRGIALVERISRNPNSTEKFRDEDKSCRNRGERPRRAPALAGSEPKREDARKVVARGLERPLQRRSSGLVSEGGLTPRDETYGDTPEIIDNQSRAHQTGVHAYLPLFRGRRGRVPDELQSPKVQDNQKVAICNWQFEPSSEETSMASAPTTDCFGNPLLSRL